MPIPVRMPKFGQTMTEGTIVGWVKKVGDPIRKGEVILKIETDKSELDVESDDEGHLIAILAQPHQTVACGEIIAWLGAKGEKV
jgi:pyruvate/2-oxoglutarate dehydrogenase complex dihydrolipoamide acyltransferase (E2) component